MRQSPQRGFSRRYKSWCAAALLACGMAQALAQSPYPNKSVRLVVPFAPGGFTDVVARILGQKLSAAMGQQFVVENKAGAGSTIGTAEVAKAAPDGYTLVMISTTHTISPWVYKSLPYDPIKSFVPITKLVDSAYVLLVNPKLPANTVKELIALAKAQPDTLHYASCLERHQKCRLHRHQQLRQSDPHRHRPSRRSCRPWRRRGSPPRRSRTSHSGRAGSADPRPAVATKYRDRPEPRR